MKKVLKFLFFTSLFLLGFQLLAQPDGGALSPISDILNELVGKHFVTITAYAALVTTLSAGLIKMFGNLSSFGKQLVSVVIGLILAIATHYLGFGIFADMTLVNVIKTAVITTAGSNFIWDLINGIFLKGNGVKLFKAKTE